MRGGRNAAAALKVTRMEAVVKMDCLEEHVTAVTRFLPIQVPRAPLESFLSGGIGVFLFLTHHIIQADLEFRIFLHQLPEHRNASPLLAKLFLKPKWSALRPCESVTTARLGSQLVRALFTLLLFQH